MKYNFKKVDLFYFAWILMLIHLCVANSSYLSYSIKYVSYFSGALVLCKIFLSKYTLREVKISALLILFGAISAKTTTDMRTLWFSLFIVAAKNIDFDKVVKISFWTILICCIIFILGSVFGFSSITRESLTKGTLYSFGLGHPNMASQYYSIITLMYIYLNYTKVSYKHILGFTILELVIFYLTKCTTGLIVFFSVAMVLILLKNKTTNLMLIKKFIYYGLLFLILFFSLTPIIYNDYFAPINDFITGRLSQANYYYVKYGINLFGNNVFSDLNSLTTDNILDGGYSRMLILNGLVFYIVIVTNYIYSLKKYIKLKKNNVLVLLFFFIVYTCVENVGTYIFMNVTLLLFKDIIFSEGVKYENS